MGISFVGMENKVEALFREIKHHRHLSASKGSKVMRQTLIRSVKKSVTWSRQLIMKVL